MSEIAIERPRELRFSTAVALALGVFSVLIAAAFVGAYWVRFGDMIAESGRAVFAERQSAISAQLNGVFEGPQFAALSLAASDQVRNGDITETEEILLAIHAFNPQIANIKIGLASGLYFTTSRIAPIPDTRYYTPPPDAAYAVVTVEPTADGHFNQTVRFRDRDLRAMADQIKSPSSTDVRALDWYQEGNGKVGQLDWIGRTIPGRNRTRISFLTGFAGESTGAVSIDVGQDDVTTALKVVHNVADEHLVVFDKDGKFYGSTLAWADDAPTEGNLDLGRMIYESFGEVGAFEDRILRTNDGEFYASAVPISLRGSGELSLYAGIAKRLDTLEAPFRSNLYATLAMVFLTWALTLPVAVVVARRVARPLLSLCDFAEATLQLRFDFAGAMTSGISEFQALIDSTRRSGAALQNICRFVPRDHVKRIIATGSANVFGERRRLSLLMTDVNDFTTMAEKLDPERLLTDMTEYLTKLTDEILAEGGTVDKFVGDAIFSYWNGVTDQPGHESMSCRAALRMKSVSERLEAEWKAANKWPWHTRIGLHAGEVVVGNIGSNERLDFTVIGSSVNLASRIEGLNKHYGTVILATEDIRRACEDEFLFRAVDRVAPKGVHDPMNVHELVGARKDVSREQIANCAAWDQAFDAYLRRDWDAALERFKAIARRETKDATAMLYVARCHRLLADPPPAAWDGVERYDQK